MNFPDHDADKAEAQCGRGGLRLASETGAPLSGSMRVAGDKSLSHRALILGACACGDTDIEGWLDSADTRATADALRAMGATIERRDDRVIIRGAGREALAAPKAALDLGNSGTGARLLMGLAAGLDIEATFTGDASLQARPMGRVFAPLRRMGARIRAAHGDRLPATVKGAAPPSAIAYASPVASAQVKSAVLLAGLGAHGVTELREARPTRDHTERMLKAFGAKIASRRRDGATIASLEGPARLTAARLSIPADPSSAAFAIVAALITPGSDILARDVLVNPLRIGLYETLRDMGADIAFENRREAGGEPVADIRARHSPLKGVAVPPERAPAMIDEYPILAIAAAFAEGVTVMQGVSELRVKESDRLSAMARGLAACGVAVEEGEDVLQVRGVGGGRRPSGGAEIAAQLDHRIAMAFLVLGGACEAPVMIDDAGPIATSYPGFVADMNALGARIRKIER